MSLMPAAEHIDNEITLSSRCSGHTGSWQPFSAAIFRVRNSLSRVHSWLLFRFPWLRRA